MLSNFQLRDFGRCAVCTQKFGLDITRGKPRFVQKGALDGSQLDAKTTTDG
jgi:hypothetical protein